jgi:hypothetical protein
MSVSPLEKQVLFWDVDPKTIDPDKHAKYIIERIVDFGSDDDVRWMWKRYSKEFIHDTVVNSRGIRPESKSFWTLLTAQTLS